MTHPRQGQDGATPLTGTGEGEEEAEQQNEGGEEEAGSCGWLLKADDCDKGPTPMDTCVKVPVREDHSNVDQTPRQEFTKEKVFAAASIGSTGQLQGLLSYLQINDKRLTSPEFIDKRNGKSALLKALLNLKDGKNDTIEIFLDIAEKTGDLKNFINKPYCDFYYKGQTPLHIAIERRSFDHVKLLVEKGADVQAKANGEFFQLQSGPGFYFGELPLSLAACTNQLDVVSFLMENSYNRADPTDTDSQGNTILHALVVISDNSPENTDFIIKMYDEILIRHTRLGKKGKAKLEDIKNHQGMNPLKLAAKLGKIRLFRHLVQCEFMDEETKHLSRKYTEWVYGPIHSSLYDTTSLDTNEENSVLDIIVFGSEIPNRHEMLQIEPLRSLLEEKWKRFASKMFLMNFLVYLIYLGIFTTVAFNRKEGEPPFPVEDHSVDHLRCTGELITVVGAVYFFCKAIVDFKRKPPKFKALHLDGFNEILFFFQAIFLLVCTVMYGSGRKEYVGPLVLSLAMAWVNVLYYSRGSKRMGMYNVMMQRMILSDIMHFLFVYVIFLFGFSAAVVTLIQDDPAAAPESKNTTVKGRALFDDDKFQCKRPTYKNVGFTMLEMFKFTIGMGDLELTDHMQYKEVFYILLISYIVLTYILLLNMLIALMGDTVEKISRESENIWKLQRALTILDLEKSLPRILRNKLYSDVVKSIRFKENQEYRSFIRVEETDWKTWRSNLGIIKEEDSGNDDIPETRNHETLGYQRGGWRTNPLLGRIRGRRQVQLNTVV